MQLQRVHTIHLSSPETFSSLGLSRATVPLELEPAAASDLDFLLSRFTGVVASDLRFLDTRAAAGLADGGLFNFCLVVPLPLLLPSSTPASDISCLISFSKSSSSSPPPPPPPHILSYPLELHIVEVLNYN
uniref:Uncharacterized protein n=1 Tax=Cacopsylla melanoneura TaxID=428564 RepID=A0A8D8LGM8_9HEMI